MLLHEALRIRGREVVALTGGGGKTTLMFRLADELVAAGRRVVTTMTTHIFVGQMARAPGRLVLSGEGALLAQLPTALAEHQHVIIAGATIVEQDKVEGVPPGLIARIAAHHAVDVVIVEADGSRRLPFKAPAAHEPVVPSAATLVVPVVGLSVLGQPLAAAHVHRPERVAALTGAALGDPVTPEMVAAVLAHPAGGAKGAPPAARLVPFLNQADDGPRQEAAREIARRLLGSPRGDAPAIDAAVIGAAQADPPAHEVWGRVTAVVLAAGGARRFGALKQVQPWRGRPLVAHVAAQALACPDIDRVVVVTGAEADRVQAALRASLPDADLDVVTVEEWAHGQSRSVRAGLSAATARGQPAAVVFLLADQPGVTPELLSALAARHRATLAPVVAPRHAGRRGNPVLFDRATWPEFARLSGDIGARPIIEAHRRAIAWLDWPTPEVLHDIDTPDDYRE